MARRKTSKGKKVHTPASQTAKIEQLLEERAHKKPKHNKNKAVTTTPALKGEFAAVLEKFAPKQPGKEKTETVTSKEIVPRKESTDSRATNLPEENDNPSSNKENKEHTPTVKKNAIKPTLTELKSVSVHPSTVDTHDVNAPYPYLLTAIKAGPHTVPVPPHWQNRRGYLSGRSLLTKRPFVLPEPLQQTGIEEMRQVLNTDASPDKDETSLKSDARSRVQPRSGALDIDYSRAYSAVYQAGRKYRPPLLLPLGDLYYENRGLDHEAQWRSWHRKYAPGKLSSKLREAMRLGPGQLPPWCRGMTSNKGGKNNTTVVETPPAYSGMLVCGVNWDISNLTDERYAEVPAGGQGGNSKTNYFGAIVTFDKETMPEGLVKARASPDQEEEKSASIEKKETTPASGSADIPLSVVERDTMKPSNIANEQPTNDDDKPLYTVIDTEASTEVTAVPTRGDNTDTDSEQELESFRF
ncbi:U2 snRNP complex subunit [Maudiozyma humilis]|uniref:U2 snRNP complex subunit n=1 Tax=Maudiozyma humilis TaxID=51915 RepID=A0AAV5RZB6_MAUHU|nr:U2 snRNP complex subunit [Kazachstania humilis]